MYTKHRQRSTGRRASQVKKLSQRQRRLQHLLHVLGVTNVKEAMALAYYTLAVGGAVLASLIAVFVALLHATTKGLNIVYAVLILASLVLPALLVDEAAWWRWLFTN